MHAFLKFCIIFCLIFFTFLLVSGIAYCKRATQEKCEECYHGTELLPELYTKEKFEELKEELEELRHELEELRHESQTEEEERDFEHFLEEFEEKCVGPVHCLTEEEKQGVCVCVVCVCVCVCVCCVFVFLCVFFFCACMRGYSIHSNIHTYIIGSDSKRFLLHNHGNNSLFLLMLL